MDDTHPYPHAPEREISTEALVASMVAGLAQLAARAHGLPDTRVYLEHGTASLRPTAKRVIESRFAQLDTELRPTSTQEAA